MHNVRRVVMATFPSFTKYYWAAWLGACGVFVSSLHVASSSTALGWFALFGGLGPIYALHFELGRLLGFLKAHCPAQYAQLPSTRAFEFFALFHPALVRTFWRHKHARCEAYTSAILVYRSAWLFTCFAVCVVVALKVVL